MARIKETFNSRAWFMIECDDPNCEQRFDDRNWRRKPRLLRLG